MPVLTALATRLITERYHVSAAVAQRRYRDTTGLDFASQLERLFPNHPANFVVAARFDAAKRDEILPRPVFPEVRSALAFFRARGIQTFLCSSTTADIIAACVERHGLAGHFDATTGFRPGYSKDAQIAGLLEVHGIRPEEAVFIGDSLSDGAFARAAGVRFIGLQRIFTAAEFRARGLRSAADLAAVTRLWTKAQAFEPSTPKAPLPPKANAIRPPRRPWPGLTAFAPPASAPHPSPATPHDSA